MATPSPDTDFLPILRRAIMGLGYDESTASRFAVLLGDTPLKDADGNILVMEGDTLLATLPPLKTLRELWTGKSNQAKEMIFAMLRQADSDVLPRVLRTPLEILALVDDATAQRLYQECAAEIERASGLKFEWI